MKKFILFLLSGMKLDYFYNIKWVVNLNNGEVHNDRKMTTRCGYLSMRNKRLMSDYDLKQYQKKHPFWDGCGICNKEFHKRKK